MTISLGNALKSVKEDSHWLKKVFIGGLIYLVSLIGEAMLEAKGVHIAVKASGIVLYLIFYSILLVCIYITIVFYMLFYNICYCSSSSTDRLRNKYDITTKSPNYRDFHDNCRRNGFCGGIFIFDSVFQCGISLLL